MNLSYMHGLFLKELINCYIIILFLFLLCQFPRRTDNELKNFINSRKRSLKNSKKQLIPENINHVDELKESVGAISYQQNNASQEEIALPRMEFDHQDIMHGNYLRTNGYLEAILYPPKILQDFEPMTISLENNDEENQQR